MVVVRTLVIDLSNIASLGGRGDTRSHRNTVFRSAMNRRRPAIGGFLSFARFRPIMTRTPASAGRGNAPSGRQSPSPRCTCRHRSPLARWSIRCTPPDGGRAPGAVADAAGTLPATLVAGALWLLVAGGFLYAFAAELDAMRTRTAWSPPPAKGYLILAAGSLLAHPVTGTPFCSCSSPDTRFIADCESVSGAGSAPTARTFIPTRFVM